jgi:hypothetical protein
LRKLQAQLAAGVLLADFAAAQASASVYAKLENSFSLLTCIAISTSDRIRSLRRMGPFAAATIIWQTHRESCFSPLR